MLWLFVVKAFSSHFRQILQFRGKLRLEFLGSFVEVRLGFRDPTHKGVHLLWTQHHVSETGEQQEFCTEAHHPVFLHLVSIDNGRFLVRLFLLFDRRFKTTYAFSDSFA